MEIFKTGDTLKTDDGKQIKIIRFIASGGQGEVYEVDFEGQKKALKWYTNAGQYPKKFYENLSKNVKCKRNSRLPATHECFLWPEEITEPPKSFNRICKKNSFGYIMDLKPAGYEELSKILASNIQMPFTLIVDASLKIIEAFQILHSAGKSYQDLNDGNFFINPKTGDVKIGDCDNVTGNKENNGIAGKPRYMAPEIVLGKQLPDTETDRHSLGVILSLLLFHAHPLEGKNWVGMTDNDANMQALYGTMPIFVEDEKNFDNRPDKVIHKGFITLWDLVPDYIKKIFREAFSYDRLHKNKSRISELEWRKAYVRLRSEIIRCKCGNEVFIKSSSTTNCDICKKPITVDHWFEISNGVESIVTAAQHCARLYRCQVDVACSWDNALQPVAVVVKHNVTGELGVLNKLPITLDAVTVKGTKRAVKPKEVIPFKSGISFKAFGGTVTLKTL